MQALSNLTLVIIGSAQLDLTFKALAFPWLYDSIFLFSVFFKFFTHFTLYYEICNSLIMLLELLEKISSYLVVLAGKWLLGCQKILQTRLAYKYSNSFPFSC